MSKNKIFAQKLIKLWACQACQNKKKHPVDEFECKWKAAFKENFIMPVRHYYLIIGDNFNNYSF
jgi:hypothetical protein